MIFFHVRFADRSLHQNSHHNLQRSFTFLFKYETSPFGERRDEQPLTLRLERGGSPEGLEVVVQ